MREIQAIYQNGHTLYSVKDPNTQSIREAEGDERIAGSAGWVDTYLVYHDNFLRARIPAWLVIAEYV